MRSSVIFCGKNQLTISFHIVLDTLILLSFKQNIPRARVPTQLGEPFNIEPFFEHIEQANKISHVISDDSSVKSYSSRQCSMYKIKTRLEELFSRLRSVVVQNDIPTFVRI